MLPCDGGTLSYTFILLFVFAWFRKKRIETIYFGELMCTNALTPMHSRKTKLDVRARTFSLATALAGMQWKMDCIRCVGTVAEEIRSAREVLHRS